MKNLSLSNLFQCHLIYTTMVRVAFTLTWWRCQNILTYLTLTLIYHIGKTPFTTLKIIFFRSFKSDHTTSNYLDLTRGTAEIKKLVKLRISKHKLMIELGRYNQITRDNRNCPFCGSNQIEDEIHFLFHCSKCSLISNNFYNKVKILIPNITQLPVNLLINELMNTSNYLAIGPANRACCCCCCCWSGYVRLPSTQYPVNPACESATFWIRSTETLQNIASSR